VDRLFAVIFAGIESSRAIVQRIKTEVENCVFESLLEVEAAVIEAVKSYLINRSAVKKLTLYSWMNNTPT
jgi:hypothetical protein